MNKELLLKVKEQILREPAQFEMSGFYQNYTHCNGVRVPNCGTAACIAGWAIAIDRNESPAQCLLLCKEMDFWMEGMKILGIGNVIAEKLFLESEWPDELSEAYYDATDRNDVVARARIAAQVIDNFIETYDNRPL